MFFCLLAEGNWGPRSPSRAQLELFSSNQVLHFIWTSCFNWGRETRIFSFNPKNNLQHPDRIVCHVCHWVLLVFFPVTFPFYLFLILILVKHTSAKLFLSDFGPHHIWVGCQGWKVYLSEKEITNYHWKCRIVSLISLKSGGWVISLSPLLFMFRHRAWID